MNTQCTAYCHRRRGRRRGARDCSPTACPAAASACISGRPIIRPCRRTRRRLRRRRRDGGRVRRAPRARRATRWGPSRPTAGGRRRGGFGDVDRDEVATFEDGVRRAHIATPSRDRAAARAGRDRAARPSPTCTREVWSCSSTPAELTDGRAVTSGRGRCLHADIDTRRRHDQQDPGAPGRDHRHLRGDREAMQQEDARRGARAARGDVAQPGGAQDLARVRPQGREVGRVRRAT